MLSVIITDRVFPQIYSGESNQGHIDPREGGGGTVGGGVGVNPLSEVDSRVENLDIIFGGLYPKDAAGDHLILFPSGKIL